jgi:hypothetical protein
MDTAGLPGFPPPLHGHREVVRSVHRPLHRGP